MRRQVERKMGAIIDQAEKNDLPLGLLLLELAVPGAKQRGNRLRPQNNRLRFAGFAHEDKALRSARPARKGSRN